MVRSAFAMTYEGSSPIWIQEPNRWSAGALCLNMSCGGARDVTFPLS